MIGKFKTLQGAILEAASLSAHKWAAAAAFRCEATKEGLLPGRRIIG